MAVVLACLYVAGLAYTIYYVSMSDRYEFVYATWFVYLTAVIGAIGAFAVAFTWDEWD